ncbi:hypothetical protein E5288_WYG014959 [Bos mutus]|uniref:Uncharacterized protein n=1 Tax=Bos mutus TaxID=72004 RepID=A0A6B0RWF9_9CETA|nr:hypothetical protein [Bos mutus]
MPGSRCPPKSRGSSSDPPGPRPTGHGIDVCIGRVHVPQAVKMETNKTHSRPGPDYIDVCIGRIYVPQAVTMKTNKTHGRPGPDYSRANSAPSPPPPPSPPHHHQECPEHLHTCRGKPHGPEPPSKPASNPTPY